MRLLWTAAAREDRRLIYDFIEADNPAAALMFDEQVAEKTLRLTDHPHLGRPGRVGETREWVVHPNYILVYEITPEAIHILRLLHAARQWPSL